MSGTAVWNDSAGVLTRGVPNPTPPVIVDPQPTTGARFQGDVGVGKIRLGATDGQNSIDSFDALIFGSASGARKHSTSRNYNNDSSLPNGKNAVLRMADNVYRQLALWINQGRMPMWSFKFFQNVSGTYSRIPCAKILDGSHDADLDYNFAQLDKLPGPVFVAAWHEPEDDFPVSPSSGDSASDYRAAQQYIIRRWKAGTHKNAVWCSPFFMAYTFKSGSGRDFRAWHPNWDGTKWIDLVRVDGCDFYNPQAGVSAGDVNDTWSTQVNRFLNARAKVGAPALPWIIGEMGLMNQYPSLSSTGNTVPDFMADMVTTGGGKQGLVAVCLWNNDGFAFLPGTDPGAEKTNGWKAAVKLPNVVLA